MMPPTVSKAVTIGVVVLIVANVLWLGVLWEVRFHEALRLALLAFPSLAALLVSYLAPRKKILLGISMAAWGAVIGTLSTLLYERLGISVDRIGGPIVIFWVLLAYQLAFCTLGSVVGYLIWRYVNREKAAKLAHE